MCQTLGDHMFRNQLYPRLPVQMSSVTAKICATKRAVEIHFMQGSWNREISRFAMTSSDSPPFWMAGNHVQGGQGGHDLYNGQNLTGSMCTRKMTLLSTQVNPFRKKWHTCTLLEKTYGVQTSWNQLITYAPTPINDPFFDFEPKPRAISFPPCPQQYHTNIQYDERFCPFSLHQ